VLDEADEMLDLGFREIWNSSSRPGPNRRTLLFWRPCRASLWHWPRNISRGRFGTSRRRRGGHADIDYRAIRIAPGDVDHAVVNTLRFSNRRARWCSAHARGGAHCRRHCRSGGFSVVALSVN